MSDKATTGSVDRVRAALDAHGVSAEIRRFPAGTRTAEDAAAAIGCGVGQIAKSLIFRAKSSGRPVLVIARGDGRVDERKIRDVLGEKIGRADADFVRTNTGFAIGGVAPVGHVAPVVTFVDAGLWEFGSVWASAGAPDAVFETTADALLAISGGERVEVR